MIELSNFKECISGAPFASQAAGTASPSSNVPEKPRTLLVRVDQKKACGAENREEGGRLLAGKNINAGATMTRNEAPRYGEN